MEIDINPCQILRSRSAKNTQHNGTNKRRYCSHSRLVRIHAQCDATQDKWIIFYY